MTRRNKRNPQLAQDIGQITRTFKTQVNWSYQKMAEVISACLPPGQTRTRQTVAEWGAGLRIPSREMVSLLLLGRADKPDQDRILLVVGWARPVMERLSQSQAPL